MPTPLSSCEAARQALWPDPLESGSAEARAHYDTCPSCQQFFIRDRRLADRLAGLERPAASGILRTRVTASLRSARRRTVVAGRATLGLVAVAAAVVLAVLTRGDDMEQMAAPFASAAVATDSASLEMSTTSHSSLGRWFAAALGGPVGVPAITGAELVGGRVGQVDGHRAAIVLYRMHGDPLTYFALANMGGRGPAPDGIVMAEAGDVKVAMWRDAGGVRAVAAAMPPDDVMAVATECRNKGSTGP